MSEHNSKITVQRRELNAVLGAEEDEDQELLGRAMVYRAGDVLVPRDWLLQRCQDLDVPDLIIPDQTTPHSAYKRAMSRLVTSNPQNGDHRTDRRFVDYDGINQPLRTELELKDGDRNVNHLTADVFFPEDITGAAGGKWEHHDLGHFNYNTESQSVEAVVNEDAPKPLIGLFNEMTDRARRLQDRMQEHHTGHDLRHMIYLNMIFNSPPEWPNVIPLIDQGGLYFVPEGDLVDVIDSLAIIFREANDKFKVGGAEMAIRTMEVVDSDDKREWIRSRVEDSLEKMVDDVIDKAFETFEEGEETADEIVDTIVERIDAEGDNAQQYNSLLQAKLDVESMLAQKATEADEPEKEEIVQRAMEQADL